MSNGSGVVRERVVLTNRTIEALRPEATPYRISDLRCAGLAVRVSSNGLITWDLAFRIKGAAKVRRTSLGRYPHITLETARVRATELTRAARTGVDLIADDAHAREAAEARITVAKLIEMYVRRRVVGRLRTAADIERRLTRALAPILNRHAADIRRRDVRELFDACADAGFRREAQQRKQTAGAMFRWALSQDLIAVNPTAGLTGYDPGTPRNRVLSSSEIAAFWKLLDEGCFSPNATAIFKLQLATGARVGEISGLCVEEIDQSHWIWRLPAGRSKNLRQRATPLVGIAKEILRHRLGVVGSGPLFVNEAGKAMRAADVGHSLMARRGRLKMEHFTSHDLRRTVANAMCEMGLPLEQVAAVIGHEAGGKEVRTLTKHYAPGNALDIKARALRAWDERLQQIVAGTATADNVHHLRPPAA